MTEALRRFLDAARHPDEDPAERARIREIAADAWPPPGSKRAEGTPPAPPSALERLMYPCGPMSYWPLPPPEPGVSRG